MKAYHKKRLLKLADLLETVPSRRFTMNVWCREGMKPCKSAGCAAGWATTIPSFKKAGLRLGVRDWGWGYAEPTVEYKGFQGYTACDKFFGKGTSQHLFAPDAYYGNTRPKTVAKRIRKFVEER